MNKQLQNLNNCVFYFSTHFSTRLDYLFYVVPLKFLTS